MYIYFVFKNKAAIKHFHFYMVRIWDETNIRYLEIFIQLFSAYTLQVKVYWCRFSCCCRCFAFRSWFNISIFIYVWVWVCMCVISISHHTLIKHSIVTFCFLNAVRVCFSRENETLNVVNLYVYNVYRCCFAYTFHNTGIIKPVKYHLLKFSCSATRDD